MFFLHRKARQSDRPKGKEISIHQSYEQAHLAKKDFSIMILIFLDTRNDFTLKTFLRPKLMVFTSQQILSSASDRLCVRWLGWLSVQWTNFSIENFSNKKWRETFFTSFSCFCLFFLLNCNPTGKKSTKVSQSLLNCTRTPNFSVYTRAALLLDWSYTHT